jgi:hypothetical protein
VLVAWFGSETVRGETSVAHRLAAPSIPTIANASAMPALPGLAWLATFSMEG